jgi:hypothetical protein
VRKLRGNRYQPGYPPALKTQALLLLRDRTLSLADIGRRLRNFMRVNYRQTIPPVPRSTLRKWAKADGLRPRRPGRRRKRAAL